jgi:5-methylcytosine-specific restriction enzyme A
MSKWPYGTAKWQRYRQQKHRRDPLCEACLQVGRLTPATVTDHRKPISQGGAPFPPLDELTSLCERCHNAKTRAEQLGETDWMVRGCDIHGYPLDPRHPWNVELAKVKAKTKKGKTAR